MFGMVDVLKQKTSKKKQRAVSKKNTTNKQDVCSPVGALEGEVLGGGFGGQLLGRLRIFATDRLTRRVGRARVVGVEVDVLVRRSKLTTCEELEDLVETAEKVLDEQHIHVFLWTKDEKRHQHMHQELETLH